MAQLNPNYGSELHLLRMLGRHREYFSRKVCQATGAEQVEWLDFPSGEKRINGKKVFWDQEWQQLQFLAPTERARVAWQKEWPQRGSGHNWDAIGQLRIGAAREWLLVEAKANVQEIRSSCQAVDGTSREKITRAFSATKAALGVNADHDWTEGYYQFCNRLTALNALNTCGAPSRLLYIYFCGDVGGGNRTCPESQGAWQAALAEQERHVGLTTGHAPEGSHT